MKKALLRDAYQSTDYSHHVTAPHSGSARRAKAMIPEVTLIVVGLVGLVVTSVVLLSVRDGLRKLKPTIPTWHGGQLVVAWALAGIGYLSAVFWNEHLLTQKRLDLAGDRVSYLRRCRDRFTETDCGLRWEALRESTLAEGFDAAVAPIGITLALVMLVITWRWFGFQTPGRPASQAELPVEPPA